MKTLSTSNWYSPELAAAIDAETKAPRNNQVVGNVGLYYVCYQLSKRG